jgi:hypothetical protein
MSQRCQEPSFSRNGIYGMPGFAQRPLSRCTWSACQVSKGPVFGRFGPHTGLVTFRQTFARRSQLHMLSDAFRQHQDCMPTHGYAATREAAMAAFAKSWRRDLGLVRRDQSAGLARWSRMKTRSRIRGTGFRNIHWLDVGRPDHLGPLLGFRGDELAEVGGRACKRCAS